MTGEVLGKARMPLVFIAVLLALTLLAFELLQRQVTGAWLAFAMHPQAVELLESSLDDQRQLAKLEPRSEADYRQRFDELETLLGRLRILEHSRDEIVRRYQRMLRLLVIGSIVLLGVLVLWIRARDERRLSALGDALADLAAGRTDIDLGERRRDTIGRIARMVESTSRRMARDRQRLASLENLSAWQEAARRHAHEMRTPLTGARLELSRLDDMLEESPSNAEGGGQLARTAIVGVRQELERLGRFTEAFTSFARLPQPRLQVIDLDLTLRELVTTFASAWPILTLRYQPTELPPVAADRDMLRQVLVNLCDNSALAIEQLTAGDSGAGTSSNGSANGVVELSARTAGDQVMIDVADNGPGIDPAIRARLFEPYSTTRGIGQGMGLGLAICRKILLDHGGDLELVESSPDGAVFRLTLPIQDDEATPTEVVDIARPGAS